VRYEKAFCSSFKEGATKSLKAEIFVSVYRKFKRLKLGVLFFN
jgi:hypothetical protein